MVSYVMKFGQVNIACPLGSSRLARILLLGASSALWQTHSLFSFIFLAASKSTTSDSFTWSCFNWIELFLIQFMISINKCFMHWVPSVIHLYSSLHDGRGALIFKGRAFVATPFEVCWRYFRNAGIINQYYVTGLLSIFCISRACNNKAQMFFQ